MLIIYAVIGALVALVIALYHNVQQKALRLSQLHKDLRHLTEQLESTQQQLKIKEKLYEGTRTCFASNCSFFFGSPALFSHTGATPSLLPSRPPHASAAD